MIPLLKKIPLFSNLTLEELYSITRICEQETVGKGIQIFRQGDLGTKFYVIVKGSIKIYNESPDGKEKILVVLRDGDSFGEFSILDGEPRSASAATLEDSTLLTITLDAFHHLLEKNFSITFKIIQQLVSRLRNTNQQVLDLVFLDAKSQIYKTLLNLASKHGKRSGQIITIDVPFKDEEIAKLASISEEVTTTVLNNLRAKGIITNEQGLMQINLALFNKA